MSVTTATYSGRFIRPSNFRHATPSAARSARWEARQLSFKLRGRSPLAGPFTP